MLKRYGSCLKMRRASAGSVIPRHCWALKGTRPVVPRQFVREYTYAYAAVSPYDGILDSLVLPDVNAESMSIFLSIISERHSDELYPYVHGSGCLA